MEIGLKVRGAYSGYNTVDIKQKNGGKQHNRRFFSLLFLDFERFQCGSEWHFFEIRIELVAVEYVKRVAVL